jgi:hypothetical protein
MITVMLFGKLGKAAAGLHPARLRLRPVAARAVIWVAVVMAVVALRTWFFVTVSTAQMTGDLYLLYLPFRTTVPFPTSAAIALRPMPGVALTFQFGPQQGIGCLGEHGADFFAQ